MDPESQETRRLDPDEGAAVRLEPGMLLSGRYRLGSELGRGGMGIVFSATDVDLERNVAVKVVPGAAGSSRARESLMREARAAAALNHPHIVAVHDVGEDRGVPFFVMELVDGPSLGKAPPVDLQRIVAIAIQICEALDHAHAHSIVHRDLKPENVLLSGRHEPRSVKLADLGLAIPLQGARITREGLIVGTVAYMAPEQALGQAVDGRADLYALGVVLYELTTGRLPFSGDSPLAIISQHVNAPVVPPRALRPDIPRALETVILRLLSKDPEQRYATARETAEALRASLEGPPEDRTDEPAAAVALLDALARGRLVGRERELEEARELWLRALEGRGHCVLVSGEPGAGKTRFAREVLIQATLHGAVVLTGGCYENEATTPYLPFVEAFRRWVRAQKDDGVLRELLGDAAAPLAKLAPELESRLGPFPKRPELPPHEERLLFYDAVVRVFRDLSRRRGLVFFADDLQWADSSTLSLLGYLLRNMREERVLVIGAYRETELDRAHPLEKALVDWNRERLTTRIALRRFGPEETRAQLAALLGEDASGEFALAVHGETEGNPFFVEEVLKALIEQGSVRREGGRWARCELSNLVIPQSVKAAIANRLSRASAACNEVLRAAAVLGKTFTYPELMAAADRSEDALLDALDEAVAAQLLVAERGDAFSFTHDKIREVLYEELNPIRRRRLHLRTADGLERLRATSPVAVETLAHHFIEAGDYLRGLTYAKEAASEAQRVFAYDEAIAAFSRAEECAEHLGLTKEQVLMEEAIGQTYMLRGEPVAGKEHFERALSLATGAEPLVRARLQIGVANACVIVGDLKGLDAVHEALAILDPGVEPIETARALAVEGRFHHLAGRHCKAIELLEHAEELVRPPAQAEDLAQETYAKAWRHIDSLRENDSGMSSAQASTLPTIYAYLAGAYQHLGRFADSDRWANRSVEFGERYGFPLFQAYGYEFLGENTCSTGEWELGLSYAAREREIADHVHSRDRHGWTAVVMGMCSMMLGDLARAEREFVEGLAGADAIGERRLATLLAIDVPWVQALAGRHEEALENLRTALSRADAINLLYMRSEARRIAGVVHFRRGEMEEAVRQCDQVLELNSGTESAVSRLWNGPVHVEALLSLGRRDEARARFADYAELVARCQAPHFDREVVRLRSLLEAADSPKH